MPRLFNTFLDFIFPKTCILCKTRDTFLCDLCIRKTHRIETNASHTVYSLFPSSDRNTHKILTYIKENKKKELGYIIGSYMYFAFQEIVCELYTLQNFRDIVVVRQTNMSIYTGYIQNDTSNMFSYNQGDLLTKNVLIIQDKYTPCDIQAKRTVIFCLVQ